MQTKFAKDLQRYVFWEVNTHRLIFEIQLHVGKHKRTLHTMVLILNNINERPVIEAKPDKPQMDSMDRINWTYIFNRMHSNELFAT